MRVLHHLTSPGGLLENHITIRRQIAQSGGKAVQQDEILHREYMYNFINICLYNFILCRSCFITYLKPDQFFLFDVDRIRRRQI